jgi:tetratricopeptide (TPR) repeat protein
MRAAWVATVGVLLVGAGAAALDRAEQLQFADGLYSRGMYELAIREYLSFLAGATNGASADLALYRIAESYRHLGNRVAADAAYKRVYAEHPTGEYHFRAGLRRAELALDAGQSDAAIALLQAMVKESPPADMAAGALYLLGSALNKAGRQNEAAEHYERLLAEHPGSPFGSYAALALGAIRAAQPNLAARAAALFQMAATNPASPRVGAEAWFQLGELYYREKQYEASARAYDKLTALYPNDDRVPESRLQMAWAFHHAGLYAEALQRVQAALAGTPPAAGREADWLYLKANCERQLSRHEEAVQTYNALLEKYPQDATADRAAYERCLAYFRLGNYGEAIRRAKDLNVAPPARKDVYWLLAESHAALKEADYAIQYYRLLVEQFPESELAPDALYRLAHQLQNKGDFAPAADRFGQLARTFPSHELAAQALFASAYCLSRAGKNEDAIRDWTTVATKYPASPYVEESLYQKAMTETFLRRDAQALATWRDLLARFSATRFGADAHFWAGVLLEEAGKLEEAEAELRAALKGNPQTELQMRIQFRLGLVLQRRGRPEESAVLLQGLIGSPLRDRFSPELLEWLAEYHLGRKEFAPGADAAGLLVAKTQEPAWLQIGWNLVGRGQLGQGRTAEARQSFEKAVDAPARTPAAADACLSLGQLALDAGAYPEARQRFERAAGLASTEKQLPVRARAYAGMGRAFKAEGRLDDAAKHFLSVAILFDGPDLVPECLFEAAAALRTLGRADESRTALKELSERYPDSPWAKRALP